MNNKFEGNRILLGITALAIGISLLWGNSKEGSSREYPSKNCFIQQGWTRCRAKVIESIPTGLGWKTTFLTQDGQTLTSYAKRGAEPTSEYQNWEMQKEEEYQVGDFSLSNKQIKETKEYCAQGNGYRNTVNFWVDNRGSRYTVPGPKDVKVNRDYAMATISPNGYVIKWRTEMTQLEKTICGVNANYF